MIKALKNLSKSSVFYFCNKLNIKVLLFRIPYIQRALTPNKYFPSTLGSLLYLLMTCRKPRLVTEISEIIIHLSNLTKMIIYSFGKFTFQC